MLDKEDANPPDHTQRRPVTSTRGIHPRLPRWTDDTTEPQRYLDEPRYNQTPPATCAISPLPAGQATRPPADPCVCERLWARISGECQTAREKRKVALDKDFPRKTEKLERGQVSISQEKPRKAEKPQMFENTAKNDMFKGRKAANSRKLQQKK